MLKTESRMTTKEMINFLKFFKKTVTLSPTSRKEIRDKVLPQKESPTHARSAHPISVTEDLRALVVPEPYNQEIHPEATINILAVVDNSIDFLGEVEEAFEMQRNDYLIATEGRVNLQTSFSRKDLSNLPWSEYWGDNWGVNTGWISEYAKKIKDEYGDKFDTIVFVIDFDNWTKEGNQFIGGWNLGLFYPHTDGYQIQLVKAGRHNVRYTYLTLLMELFHAHDDFYRRATGETLEKFFGVSDFDEDIVHGMAHQYPAKLSQEDSVKMFGEGYDRWDYKPAFKAMTEIFVKIFKIKTTQKDMVFQKVNEQAKDIYVIQNGMRFLVLNWETYSWIKPKDQKVEINPNLKDVLWGGKMVVAPDEDPLL